MSPAGPRRDDLAAPAWVGELADVRERLARLETRAEAQEAAAAERHRQLLDAVKGLEERLEQVEGRAWKVALGLAALGLGGGAGAMELVRGMVGGVTMGNPQDSLCLPAATDDAEAGLGMAGACLPATGGGDCDALNSYQDVLVLPVDPLGADVVAKVSQLFDVGGTAHPANAFREFTFGESPFPKQFGHLTEDRILWFRVLPARVLLATAHRSTLLGWTSIESSSRIGDGPQWGAPQ